MCSSCIVTLMHFKSLCSNMALVEAERKCQLSVPAIAPTSRADLENEAVVLVKVLSPSLMALKSAGCPTV